MSNFNYTISLQQCLQNDLGIPILIRKYQIKTERGPFKKLVQVLGRKCATKGHIGTVPYDRIDWDPMLADTPLFPELLLLLQIARLQDVRGLER